MTKYPSNNSDKIYSMCKLILTKCYHSRLKGMIIKEGSKMSLNGTLHVCFLFCLICLDEIISLTDINRGCW